jgi:pyruvate kinase
VDVIRLNLSHVKVGEVEEVFLAIKKAIRRSEMAHHDKKKIALLADLPGPKIRFRLPEPITFRVGEEFIIHFEEVAPSDGGATVYVDNNSLRKALLDSGRGGKGGGRSKIKYNVDTKIVENLLGQVSGPRERRDAYRGMMNEFRTRLSRSESIFVIVGDGEVIMQVSAKGLSVDASSLTCTILTVKGGSSQRAQGGKGAAGSAEPPAPADGDELEADGGASEAPANEVTLKGNKGFTLKGVDLNIPSFTGEDREKLEKLLEAEYKDVGRRVSEPVLAFVALSFAQTADDILKIKEFIERKLRRLGKGAEEARLESPSIIAKIETKKGWENRDFILDVADGIMVARGDLGLQMNIEEVPAIQKKLINLCNKRGKPVITATEMLKTMTESIEPTRAEGTDVFNAILDGSDAVMMSEETSRGMYPLHSIRKMISIAVQAELYFGLSGVSDDLRRAASLLRYQEFLKDDYERVQDNDDRFEQIGKFLDEMMIKGRGLSKSELQTLKWRKDLYKEKWGKSVRQITTNRITQATCTMSEAEDTKCIIAASTSGRTVRMISRLKPNVAIVGAAHDVINTRKLVLSYGVSPICIGKASKSEGTEGIFLKCQRKIMQDEFLSQLHEEGNNVIFTAGTLLGKPGTTDLIHMRKI